MSTAAFLAACAASLSATAQTPFTSPRDSRLPSEPESAWRRAALAPSTGEPAISAERLLPAVSREAPALRGAPTLATLLDPFESLLEIPQSLNAQFSQPVWTPEGIGSFSRWDAQGIDYAGVVSDVVAGNATRKIRLIAGVGQGVGGSFLAAEGNFFENPSESLRFVFGPDGSTPARLEHDLFISSISTTWTSDAVADLSGLITSRLLWGGTILNAGGGLPSTGGGHLEHMYALGRDSGSFTNGRFYECVYTGSAPTGETVGAQVETPIGVWFRVIHEITPSSEIVIRIDLLDGTGEHEIYRGPFAFGTVFDEVQFLSSFETEDDAIYVDNLMVSGAKFDIPVPPTLQCDYLDDMEWLNVGQISIQTERWFDAVSSKAIVIASAQTGNRIRQRNNISSDNLYRREFSTEIPEAYAYDTYPVSVCAELETSIFTATVRGLALIDSSGINLTSRVLIGRDNGAGYDNFVYVQINDDYDPVDDEGSTMPFQPGPEGNGGVPVVGVDVVNTGYSWTNTTRRDVCMEIQPSGQLTVSVDGVAIAGGGTGISVSAFTNNASELLFESENNAGGPGDNFFVDNVTVECESVPLVELPPLELVYEDDLSWGIAGVSMQSLDDDGDQFTPFRWFADDGAPLFQTPGPGGMPTIALRLENLLQDGEGSAPEFVQTAKASTEMPQIVASPTRGWIAGADLRLTDTRTTRFLNVSQESITPGTYVLGTSVALEAGTQLVWVLNGTGVSSNEWVNTGTTLLSLGIQPDDWFTLAIRRNLNGQFGFLVNGEPLRNSLAQPVFATPLQTPQNGVHDTLERISFGSQEEDLDDSPGSALDIARVFAWALPCEGDVTRDGVTNFSDLNAVLVDFGTTGDSPANVAPDQNNDGLPDDNMVNFTDLNAVLVGFGQTCD